MEDIRALLWNRFYGQYPNRIETITKLTKMNWFLHMIIHMMNPSQFTGRSRIQMSQSILWSSSMLELTS